MKIIPMERSHDKERIADIFVQGWRTAYRGIVPQDFLDGLTPGLWSSALSSGQLNALVACEGESFVGLVCLGPARAQEMEGWGEIPALYVLPDYFGTGTGKQLMDRAVSALGEQGFRDIYLWVLEENQRAKGFYEAYGFERSTDTMTVTIGGKELLEVRYLYHLPDSTGLELDHTNY